MVGLQAVARRVAGALLWVHLLLGGLFWLAGAVEGAVSAGATAGLLAGLLRCPGLLSALLPLISVAGVALARLWMERQGEDRAMALCGWSPRRSLPATLVVLGLWAALWSLAQAQLLWRWEARAELLQPALRPSWVWLGDRALRPADGLQVRLDGGRLQLSPGDVPAQAVALARELERPRLASAHALSQSELPLAQAERVARPARLLASLALGALAWTQAAQRRAALAWPLLAWMGLELVLLRRCAEGAISPTGLALGLGLPSLALLLYSARSQ
jgi:hypothetical protein